MRANWMRGSKLQEIEIINKYKCVQNFYHIALNDQWPISKD